MNVDETLTKAAEHRKAGRWREADELYRGALQAEPNNAELLYAAGTLSLHTGNPRRAAELLEQAVACDDSRARWHVAAAEAYRQIGNFAKAAAANRRALELQPKTASAHAGLAAIHYQQGNLPAAAEQFQEALRIDSQSPWLHSGYAHVLLDQERLGEAEASFHAAAELAPRDRGIHEGLGLSLMRQEKYEAARAAFEVVVEVAPDNDGALTNLGNVLQALGLLEEAVAKHRRAIELNPRSAIALNNLGTTLSELGHLEEAIARFTQAAQLQPGNAKPFRNLSEALFELGRIDEAMAAARRAIELEPRVVVGHSMLAVCLRSLGRIDEAIQSHRHALAMEPENAVEQDNLLYTLNFHPDKEPAEIAAEHRQWARTHVDPITADSRPHAPPATSKSRLRVGYVGAYFRDHSVNFFVEPVLAAHDHDVVEVFCYSASRLADATTERLMTYADLWRDITAESDDDASRIMRRDEIDILVDLSGHIPGNRLRVFARKPAPIQATYLGYQNTTGMTAIDYRLTDQWADPPGVTDELYSEKLLRLPRSFFCYLPSHDAPAVTRLPALENGYVTFGSFNYFAKISPVVLAAWARLLHAVPKSRLLILPHAVRSLQSQLSAALAEHGIEPERWTLVDSRPRGDYLKVIGQVDVALDPFPFNGHTTTCDALWQGVPVVTLAGAAYCSRFGSSAHVNLGLEDLIADSPESYVEIAARLAGDVDRLADLRSGLRERMRASPLLDATGFTRNLEAAYRQMWADWCANGSGH